MPRVVYVFEVIVERVAISIERLWFLPLLRYCIGLDEPCKRGIIVPCPIVVQPNRRVIALPGILERGRGGPAAVARAAPGEVALLGGGDGVVAVASVGLGCASQVIAEEVGDGAAFIHRHALAAGVVVFDHRGGAAAPLEVGADVDGGHAAWNQDPAITRSRP